MSDDSKLDEFIAREAKGYRADSPPRADVMWSRIERDVAGAIRGGPRQWRVTRHWPVLVAGAGIAAALFIGVAIGRQTVRSDTAPPIAQSPEPRADSARDALMYASTISHIAQTGAFLTEVRADLKTGRHDPLRDERSRQLLTRTRLLLANDAARTGPPTVERLLQDLELVLAEIAALPDSGLRRSLDAKLLDDRLRVGTVLPRIRAYLPKTADPVGGGL